MHCQIHTQLVWLLCALLASASLHVVLLQDCLLQHNRANLDGGAVVSAEVAQLTIRHCSFFNNSAPSYSGRGGGGVCALQMTELVLADTIITHNSAFQGGGVAIIANSSLRLEGNVTVAANEAAMAGGGFALDSPKFLPNAVLAAAVNNTATYFPDVAVQPRAIEIMNDTKQINLTSRLGASQGVVVVAVNVTGWHGLPVNIEVLPFLDGVPLP